MEKKSPALGVVAVLAIIGSLVYLYFTQVATGPKINLKPFEILGFVAAEEAAKILGGQGRVILINEGRVVLDGSVEDLDQGGQGMEGRFRQLTGAGR